MNYHKQLVTTEAAYVRVNERLLEAERLLRGVCDVLAAVAGQQDRKVSPNAVPLPLKGLALGVKAQLDAFLSRQPVAAGDEVAHA